MAVKTLEQYEDQFTLDGRVRPVNHHVTRTKVEAADKLLQAAMHGDRIAAGQLAEVHTTSDLKFNLAHLITVVSLPEFEAAERVWTQVAGVRTVPDFGPVRLQSIYGQLTGAGVAKGGAGGITGGLPTVPEGSPYPYVTVQGREAFYAKLRKLGTKFGFTWEAALSDVVGFFENIPSELRNLALDTEEREVFDALKSGTTQTLASQTLPDGVTTVANAPISPEAIWGAVVQLSNVEVDGRKVGTASGYNVVVPAGTKEYIDWKLGQTILQIQDGLLTLAPGDRSIFNKVTTVETPFLTGTEWYVLPKPGAIRRPVLELLRLRGYETPELRVSNDTGTYVGASAVPPFEGNFDTDTIDYRIRYVAGGVLWDPSYTLKSTGLGS